MNRTDESDWEASGSNGFSGWPWATPLKMEAEAIRLGIRFLQGLGITQATVCTDALTLLQVFQMGGFDPPQIQEIVAEICEWKKECWLTYHVQKKFSILGLSLDSFEWDKRPSLDLMFK
ncbi:hypothetical protein QJS10_CPA01g01376 [Acorus calamus]|uniref:RNase H type-1 domain-containing protein n=1 Tax=Acorus calamus TaxID=4465 RepID=A0AAV9FJ96_ACOCL|nr:hypothetical protein QJS10_CPA01g01376 [Acorus calamus]